jgi:hypothetical protein
MICGGAQLRTMGDLDYLDPLIADAHATHRQVYSVFTGFTSTNVQIMAFSPRICMPPTASAATAFSRRSLPSCLTHTHTHTHTHTFICIQRLDSIFKAIFALMPLAVQHSSAADETTRRQLAGP